MTDSSTLWLLFRRHVPRKKWISTREILSIMELYSSFDHDDLKLDASNVPRWQTTMRRLLQEKKKNGALKGRAGIS